MKTTLYTGPLIITENTLIKAIKTKRGWKNSDITEVECIIGPTLNDNMLIMLIDERSLSGYSDLQTIVTLPNQNIDPLYDDLAAMTAVWWHPTNSARIWRSNQKLNSFPVVRFHQAWWDNQSSFGGLRATSDRVTGITIAGNTMSFVVRPDSSFWVQNGDSWTTAMGQAILGLCTYRYGAGNYGNNYVSGLAKSGRLVHTNPARTITRNWAIFENGAGDQSVPPGRELNVFDPHIDREWVHILYVEDFASTANNVKIYIDGQLMFTESTTRPYVYNDVRKIYFGNHGNAMYRAFAGELAHFAVWKRPFTDNEAVATYQYMDWKYALSGVA